MSTLEQLYFGNINPFSRMIKKDSPYEKVNKELVNQIDRFTKKLNKEEAELFDKIADTVSELNCISEKECFIEGFRLGTKAICEVLFSNSENFTSL